MVRSVQPQLGQDEIATLLGDEADVEVDMAAMCECERGVCDDDGACVDADPCAEDAECPDNMFCGLESEGDEQSVCLAGCRIEPDSCPAR